MAAYARFHKCDLHLHSPADPSWREGASRVHPGTSQTEKKEKARQFIEACLEAGLEVIAVVDHNFAPTPEHSLLPLLRQANEEIAERSGQTPVVVFPGFEIECRVGRGGHVVCLFSPDAGPAEVNDAAAKLLPRDRFRGGNPCPSERSLQEILNVVQEEFDGLVIAAHPERDKGLLDRGTAEHWWREQEYVLPGLYAAELHKAPGDLDPNSFLGRVISNREPGYGRARPLGYVLVSDCKRLFPVADDPCNHPGCRFTWLKMSRPSIEGLRQAFLASESHIRYSRGSPDVAFSYPIITHVKARGGFLEIAELRFSPNLNCVIGGKGAGKSALFDAIRAATGHLAEEIPAKVRQDINDRLDSTAGEAQIEVGVRTPAGDFELKLCWGREPRTVVFDGSGAERHDVDVGALLPSKFLSQGEIDALAREAPQARKLFDQFLLDDLRRLEQEGAKALAEVETLDVEVGRLRELAGQKGRVRTEMDAVHGRLLALREVEQEVCSWETIQQVDGTLRAAAELGQKAAEVLGGTLQEIRSLTQQSKQLSPPGTGGVSAGREASIADRLLAAARCALSLVENQVRGAKGGLVRRLVGPESRFHRSLADEWGPVVGTAREQYEELKGKLRAKGLAPDQYESLRKQLGSKELELKAIGEAEEQLDALVRQRKSKVGALQQLWARQTELRRRKAAELSEKLEGVVGIDVLHQKDWDAFARKLDQMGLWRDRRRLSDDDLKELLEYLTRESPSDEPLSAAFCQGMRQLHRDGIGLIASLWGAEDRKAIVLKDWFPERVLERVETVSVPDKVTITVFDSRGDELGDLSHVSAGQRGFAVLSLLLAEGDGPLVVDTPEEGLDNEGLYGLLVPVLRQKKETRQILVISHNANIPVNADAELIVALEARPDDAGVVRGAVKRSDELSGQGPVVGALDRDEVVQAVVDIMEGSRDAFDRRRAKYHY